MPLIVTPARASASCTASSIEFDEIPIRSIIFSTIIGCSSAASIAPLRRSYLFAREVLTESRIFRFELRDARLQMLKRWDHVGSVELAWNMLMAVRVPSLDFEDDRLLGLGRVIVGHQPRDQLRIVLDDSCPAPDLEAPRVGIVHQEEEGAIILGQVAGGYVLPIAGVIGKTERVIIDHANEALRAAAMLHVRLAGGIGGCQVDAVALRDDVCEIGRSRAATLLKGFDCGGEGDITRERAFLALARGAVGRRRVRLIHARTP